MEQHHETGLSDAHELPSLHSAGIRPDTRPDIPNEWGRFEGELYESKPVARYLLDLLESGQYVYSGDAGSYVIGKEGFKWREELSDNAQSYIPGSSAAWAIEMFFNMWPKRMDSTWTRP